MVEENDPQPDVESASATAKKSLDAVVAHNPDKMVKKLNDNDVTDTRVHTPWSEVLHSPTDMAKFSPSLEINGNLHGLGLELAIERSKTIGRFGRRAAAYLVDISKTYDNFGMILGKASHSIHSDVLSMPDSLQQQPQTLCDSVRIFGTDARRLAQFYRTNLVAPMQTILSANRATIDIHGQRYVAARSQSLESRKRASAARTKYVKAVRAAEKTFCHWKKARKLVEDEPNKESASDEVAKPSSGAYSEDTQQPWEKVLCEYGKLIPENTERLVQRLKNVESDKARYEELVENEHKAVGHAQAMEADALNGIQKVENDRVEFFLGHVLIPVCATEGETLKRVSLTQQDFEVRPAMNDEGTPLDLKKGKDLLANIFIRQSQAYEEGMGLMNAETLGLPLEAGQLRDKVKSNIAKVEARIKAAQILADFLDVFAGAASALEIGLKRNCRAKRGEFLEELALKAVGRETSEAWKELINIFEDEAEVASKVASAMKELRSEKLDAILEKSQKELKFESDTDDNNWKTLCDAARTESKVAARYRQLKANQEKARGRVLSVDTVKSDDGLDDTGPNSLQKNRMSKALFAGSEAMKKLQENARMAIAKNNLNEAEQNATKEQQTLDEATAFKTQAGENYNRVTLSRIKKLESIATNRTTDFEKVVESVSQGIENLEMTRQEVRKRTLGEVKTRIILQSPMDDVERWTTSTVEKIKANRAQGNGSGELADDTGTGFELSVRFVVTEPVDKLLNQTSYQVPPPEFMTKYDETSSADSSDDEVEIGVQDSFDAFDSRSAEDRSNPSTPVKIRSPGNLRRSGSVPLVPGESILSSGSSLQHAISNPGELKGTRTPGANNDKSPELQAFIAQFWSDREDSELLPEIIQTISCAYRPREKGGFLIPNLYGHLYTTPKKLYFLAWDGKTFVLPWTDVLSISKEKGFMGGSDNSVLLMYSTEGEDESAFVLSRLASRESVLTHLQDLQRKTQTAKDQTVEIERVGSFPPVPQDTILKRMIKVISKPVRDVSIQRVYEKAWSEGNRTTEKPFYGPWLVEEECFEIKVEDWEFSEQESEGFVNPWCNERYTQRRLVSFKFKRTTHLYIGPPVAFVKQMQYCRTEGADKCVVAISATFEGIPYADAFGVEMRWVARRHGAKDILVEVGLEVDFKKTTMLKSQIKSGTITETKNVHIRMFDAVKRVCSAPGQSTDEVEEETMEHTDGELPQEERGLFWATVWNGMTAAIPADRNFVFFASAIFAYPMLVNFFASMFGAPAISMNEARRMSMRLDELQSEVRALRTSLDVAIEMLRQHD